MIYVQSKQLETPISKLIVIYRGKINSFSMSAVSSISSHRWLNADHCRALVTFLCGVSGVVVTRRHRHLLPSTMSRTHHKNCR